MDDFVGYIISSILGVITGIIGTICYNKLHSIYEKRKREHEKQKIKPLNLLESYVGRKATAIVSFEDNSAIEIEPLFKNGIYLLSAKINIENRPITRTDRNFVMALLTYLPAMDWSYYAECEYSLKFKIRGNINGMQLEVKNSNKSKILDEYISVGKGFQEIVFPLSGDVLKWRNIEEICFTVFCEEEYIQEKQGNFEIMDCILEK